MSALAEDSMQPVSAATWAKRVGVAVVIAALIAGLAWWLRSLGSDTAAPKRQVAKISLLPDTPPPPPPPPPKEEPRPRPQEAAKPQPVEQKQAEAPPAPPAQVKMEGEAGTGPSAFAGGSVTSDYKGGDPGTAASRPAGNGPAAVTDRAQERFFANSARQQLRDEIERHLKSDAGQLTASFSVWFEGDGSIRRFEIQPSGDPRSDADLNAALGATTRTLKLPPPPGLPQPLRFRLTVRPLG